MTTTTSTPNQPLISIKDGVIQLTVWENRKKDDSGTYRSIDITRRYKASDGTWKDSSRFSPSELTRLMALASSAQQELDIIDGTHPDPDAYR